MKNFYILQGTETFANHCNRDRGTISPPKKSRLNFIHLHTDLGGTVAHLIVNDISFFGAVGGGKHDSFEQDSIIFPRFHP